MNKEIFMYDELHIVCGDDQAHGYSPNQVLMIS